MSSAKIITRVTTSATRFLTVVLAGRGRARSEAGLGTNEMVAACVVLAAFFIAVANVVTTTDSTSERGARESRIVATNQRILDQIQTELSEAVEVFENNDIGEELFNTIEKLDTATPIEFTSLPRPLRGTVFGQELRSGSRTGNVLMFARMERTKEIACGEDDAKSKGEREGQSDASGTYEIDVYRLICYYLTPVGDGPSPHHGHGLNMFRFVSVGMADAAQIEAIESAEDQQEVMRKLVGDNVTGAWRRDVIAAPDWLHINPSAGTMDSVDFIAADPKMSDSVLENPKAYSVASNHAHESLGVGEFGVKTEARGGFPHGFEVQMMGPTSAREVMLRLALISRGGNRSTVTSSLKQQFVIGK